MDFKSSFYPRPHSIPVGKLRSTATYDLYYDMVRMAVRDHALPLAAIKPGELLFRKTRSDIAEPRKIPPRAGYLPNNRYSGIRLDGSPGQGALYLGTLSGALREHTYYRNPGSSALWLPGAPDTARAFIAEQKKGAPLENEKIHVFRSSGEVPVADLRVDSLFRLFTRYRFDVAARTPLEILVSAVSSPSDHSAARGMADAIFDSRHHSGLAGLIATSAHGDSDSGLILETHGDDRGSNVLALQGAAEQIVGTVQPVASFDSLSKLLGELPKLKKG